MNGRIGRSISLLICAMSAGLFLCAACAAGQPVTQSVSFIIFGNTRPESPFQGFTTGLDQVLSAIESRRTGILIHTGNSVYGGSEEQGILSSDVERQMMIFFPAIKRIPAAIYTIPGESDRHNGSLDIYVKHSRRDPYYSFNYGSIHFIMLNTDSSIENLLDNEQMEWLKHDLKKSAKCSCIFVITHHPVFVEEKVKGKTELRNNMLMELFIKHKVRAVFSGREERFSSSYYGGVEYHITGCGGYNDKKDNRKKFQYYLVNMENGELKITPERVTIQ